MNKQVIKILLFLSVLLLKLIKWFGDSIKNSMTSKEFLIIFLWQVSIYFSNIFIINFLTSIIFILLRISIFSLLSIIFNIINKKISHIFVLKIYWFKQLIILFIPIFNNSIIKKLYFKKLYIVFKAGKIHWKLFLLLIDSSENEENIENIIEEKLLFNNNLIKYSSLYLASINENNSKIIGVLLLYLLNKLIINEANILLSSFDNMYKLSFLINNK